MKRSSWPAFLIAITTCSAPAWGQLPDFSNLQLWFRADAGVTTNAGGDVSVWADQSGNGNNATNTTVANEPLWVANALNGKPVLRFDGVDDELSTLNNVNLTNGLSIFIVADNDVRKNYNGIFRLYSTPYGNNSDLEIYWQAGTAGSGNPVFGVNRPSPFGGLQANNAQPSAGLYYLYDLQAVANAATQRIDAVDLASAPLGSVFLPANVDPAHLGIGYGGVGTAGLLQGNIAEVIVYNTALNPSDRLTVEQYLAAKYGSGIPEISSLGYLGLAGVFFALNRRSRIRRKSR